MGRAKTGTTGVDVALVGHARTISDTFCDLGMFKDTHIDRSKELLDDTIFNLNKYFINSKWWINTGEESSKEILNYALHTKQAIGIIFADKYGLRVPEDRLDEVMQRIKAFAILVEQWVALSEKHYEAASRKNPTHPDYGKGLNA